MTTQTDSPPILIAEDEIYLNRFCERDPKVVSLITKAIDPEQVLHRILRIGAQALDHSADSLQIEAIDQKFDAMTETFHGPDNVVRCNEAAKALFGGDVTSLDETMLGEVFAEVPAGEFAKSSLGTDATALVELLPQTELCSSKREAREFLKNGSVAVNGEKINADIALDRMLTSEDLLHGSTILLRRGKKAWFATRWS